MLIPSFHALALGTQICWRDRKSMRFFLEFRDILSKKELENYTLNLDNEKKKILIFSCQLLDKYEFWVTSPL